MREAKKTTAVFLTLVILAALIPVPGLSAFADVEGDWEYANFWNSYQGYGHTTITKYIGTATEATIPEQLGTGGSAVTTILSIGTASGLTKITVGKSVTSISSSGAGAFGLCSTLTTINVNKDNGWFTSVDGILFNKDKTELWCYPRGRTEAIYSVPSHVKTIRPNAFYQSGALEAIYIPESVTTIESNAITNFFGLTVYCEKNSAAHTYAKDNGLNFSLGGLPYTVKFNKNGGSGTMKNQAITTGKSTKLIANSFTRKNYVFNGWNTKKDGSGTKYTDKKSVKNIAKAGKSITLYAQWKKVSAPTKAVTSLKLTSPKAKQLKVTYKAVSGANGYRIEYSTSKSFTKATTKTVHTTKLNYTIKSLKAKTTYYVRVTAFKVDSAKAKIYSKKTATKNLKTK